MHGYNPLICSIFSGLYNRTALSISSGKVHMKNAAVSLGRKLPYQTAPTTYS